MKLRLWLYFALLIALLLLPSCILFVEQTEYVYITQFGRPVITYDGKDQAGLHLKLPWPVQSATRFDRRLQAFDIPTQEYLILDRDTSGEEKPIPLTFDLFICWRIGSLNQQDDREAVDRFVRSFGSAVRAEQYLRTQVVSRLKQQLSQVVLNDLLNVDASQVKIEKITSNVAKAVTLVNDPDSSLEKQASQVGIELIDIRLRRFNHPVLVRDDIYAKIREERRREAETYRNQGLETAAHIRAQGDLEAQRLRAEAEAYQVKLEGQADAAAVRLVHEAAQQNPELFGIVRLLKGAQKMFADDKTQLILSLDHPLLAVFKNLPRLEQPSPSGARK